MASNGVQRTSLLKLTLAFGLFVTFGEQGWRSGESGRLPPVWPGFESRSLIDAICGLSLLLVLVCALPQFSAF